MTDSSKKRRHEMETPPNTVVIDTYDFLGLQYRSLLYAANNIKQYEKAKKKQSEGKTPEQIADDDTCNACEMVVERMQETVWTIKGNFERVMSSRVDLRAKYQSEIARCDDMIFEAIGERVKWRIDQPIPLFGDTDKPAEQEDE